MESSNAVNHSFSFLDMAEPPRIPSPASLLKSFDSPASLRLPCGRLNLNPRTIKRSIDAPNRPLFAASDSKG